MCVFFKDYLLYRTFWLIGQLLTLKALDGRAFIVYEGGEKISVQNIYSLIRLLKNTLYMQACMYICRKN